MHITFISVFSYFGISQPKEPQMNLRSFFIVDLKDMSNWIALAIAIPLLIWGVMIMVRRL